MESAKPRKGRGRSPIEPLPGISYVAEPFEWNHNPDIQAKVVQEFVDFLGCLFDLIKLMHRLPVAYIKSTTPIPADVLREILAGKGKRLGRIRDFELSLYERKQSISRSVERLLDNAAKTRIYFKTSIVLPGITKFKTHDETTASGVLRDIEKILGKKPTRPIWHTVIVNNNDPRIQEIARKKKQDIEMSKEDYILKHLIKRNNLNDRNHSMSTDKLWSKSRDYLKGKKLLPKDEPFKTQFQLAQAYLDGFVSLKDHQAYLLTLEKHWYSELLKQALHCNIVLTDDVKTAFRKLGRFYHISDEAHIGHAESKLCLLVMSLAVWDISRITMQRAVVFILQKVLALDDGGERFRAWITARRLPYVVIPPIKSEIVSSTLDLGEEAKDMATRPLRGHTMQAGKDQSCSRMTKSVIRITSNK